MMEESKVMNQRMKMTKSASTASPYELYRGSQLWKIIEKAVSDLVDNNDLTENTRRDYIVGFLCKRLQAAELTAPTRGNA